MTLRFFSSCPHFSCPPFSSAASHISPHPHCTSQPLLSLISPHPHFSHTSHDHFSSLRFSSTLFLHTSRRASPSPPPNLGGAVPSPFRASATATLTRRRGHPQSCCSASGTSWSCCGRRARMEMGAALRAATGLLPAYFARLPAAIAAPATRAWLDADRFPIGHDFMASLR